MTLTTFFLRVFLYGLVAFVTHGDDAFVLIGKAPQHTPFVIVKECVGPCPIFEDSDGKEFRGALLAGHDIKIYPFTEDDSESSPLRREPVQRELPVSVDEARSLAWIPEMNRLLGGPGQARIRDCYLDNPGDCPPGQSLLAGRMHVLSGTFRTCQLVQGSASDYVYSFQFKHFIGGSVHREQALTAVVDLTLDQAVTGDFATLVLKGYKEGEVKIKLLPVACKVNSANAMCVDIFIGNTPPTDLDDAHITGRHFDHLYDFLGASPSKLRPYKNLSQRVKAVNVQPDCPNRTDKIPNFKFDKIGHNSFHGAFAQTAALGFLAPESRSVCPMVVLDPP